MSWAGFLARDVFCFERGFAMAYDDEEFTPDFTEKTRTIIYVIFGVIGSVVSLGFTTFGVLDGMPTWVPVTGGFVSAACQIVTSAFAVRNVPSAK